MAMPQPRERLETALGYVFKRPALLARAMRHRSAGANHNERLEFLGDSVLNFCIAEKLYRAEPGCDEGALTRLRASLVNHERLAVIAAELGLADYIELGAGMRRGGARGNDSVRADALEALFGAVFLDGGIEAACVVIDNLYADSFKALPDAESLKDAKTRLQEYQFARGNSAPLYTVTAITGKDHEKQFEVRCDATGADPVTAVGGSRRKAEQAAADKILRQLADA